jgi:hypothetical protein
VSSKKTGRPAQLWNDPRGVPNHSDARRQLRSAGECTRTGTGGWACGDRGWSSAVPGPGEAVRVRRRNRARCPAFPTSLVRAIPNDGDGRGSPPPIVRESLGQRARRGRRAGGATDRDANAISKTHRRTRTAYARGSTRVLFDSHSRKDAGFATSSLLPKRPDCGQQFKASSTARLWRQSLFRSRDARDLSAREDLSHTPNNTRNSSDRRHQMPRWRGPTSCVRRRDIARSCLLTCNLPDASNGAQADAGTRPWVGYDQGRGTAAGSGGAS